MRPPLDPCRITTVEQITALGGESREATPFAVDGAQYDRELPARQRATLY